MTKFKNFLLGDPGANMEAELINRLNLKLFYVV